MSMMSRLDSLNPFKREAYSGGGSGYDAGRFDLDELADWVPNTGFADDDIEDVSEQVTGRVRDLDKNNGWINGGLDRRVESVIGVNIRLSSQPMFRLLGHDYEWRREWSRISQDLFRVWANDIEKRGDATKQLHFGAQARLAYLHYLRDGEVAAQVRMTDRGSRFRTNIKLIDCDRISNPNNTSNTERLRNGIKMDRHGAPLGYYVRVKHPDDRTPSMDNFRWKYVQATGPSGRAKFIHVINPRRIDQMRGISRLAEAVVPSKMLDKVDRAEVKASLLSAVFSFFIKSPASNSELRDAMGSAPDGQSSDFSIWDWLKFRKKKPVRVDGAQVRQLLPGEDVVVPDRQSPNANYAAFQKFVLQKIASSLGVTYPQLSQEWAGINYSSARALLNEIWRSFLEDRYFFTQQFCTPIYAAVLEEAVVTNQIAIPGGQMNFFMHKTEYTTCEWLGPGRGSVDPLKEANANNLDTAAYRKSTPELIRESGRDPEDVISEELAFREELEERGLAPANHNIKPGNEDSEEAAREDAQENRVEERETEEEEA